MPYSNKLRAVVYAALALANCSIFAAPPAIPFYDAEFAGHRYFSESTITQTALAPPYKDAIPLPVRDGLRQLAGFVARQNPNHIAAPAGLSQPNRKLTATLELLLNWNGELSPESLAGHFEFLNLSRNQNKNSKFTGYYTPMIQVSAQPDSNYRYPIYRHPRRMSQLSLSREEISSGALSNQGLELAWTDDPVGLFYVQMQGSGIMQYPDGRQTLLKFAAANKYRFKSVARYMVTQGYLNGNVGRKAIQHWLYSNPALLQQTLNKNPRYVFFDIASKQVTTASGLPVVPGHTIAVDTKYIPFGSVVLAEVPVLDRAGHTISSEWTLLLSQDRGNAVRGPAHMDIYTGDGESARQLASQLTGQGRAWLLIKRDNVVLSQR